MKLFIVLFGILLPAFTNAQDTLHVNGHDGHMHHHLHRNELGIAIAPVYFLEEEEFSIAVHLHYLYNFHHSRFSAGAGYERIFDEHEHQFAGIIIGYKVFPKFNFSISPGLLFEKDHPDPEFALHSELSYEFEIGNFHLGPALDFAVHPEDVHISLGLHLGYGF